MQRNVSKKDKTLQKNRVKKVNNKENANDYGAEKVEEVS